MTRTVITRHKPDTCECVVELVTELDDQGKQVSESRFLLMNKVCQEHRPLASSLFKSDHHELSANVLDIIEQAKVRNLKQIDDRLATETRPRVLRDLTKMRIKMMQINADIDEEWRELVQPPHAFDSHIHEQVKQKQMLKNSSSTASTTAGRVNNRIG